MGRKSKRSLEHKYPESAEDFPACAERGEEEKNVRRRDHAAEVCYSSYPGEYTIQSLCAKSSVWQRE